jgi:hypothetical protein
MKTIQQHPDNDPVMKHVCRVLTTIACVSQRKSEMDYNHPENGGHQEECPPTSERKQLYSALYGMHTEVIHNLMAVLKENAAKGETVKTTLTAPPSI